eukprot:TRINITY_DN9344_c0_g1_i3.p1 TRINITY_DN9344_c0_g1~~TRINITY_DN9344_c0_g1_i3.p1  ORF type:complete len:252 (-),score=49.97 TRINITY_DN9344_c0_g1_i3:111-866(-)
MAPAASTPTPRKTGMLLALDIAERQGIGIDKELQRQVGKLKVKETMKQVDSEPKAKLVAVNEISSLLEDVTRSRDTLAAILRNTEHIVPQLQQPWASKGLAVEAEDQASFLGLMTKAAKSSGAFADSSTAFTWAAQSQQRPTIWAESLAPLTQTLASCNRLHKAIGAARKTMLDVQTSAEEDAADAERSWNLRPAQSKFEEGKDEGHKVLGRLAHAAPSQGLGTREEGATGGVGDRLRRELPDRYTIAGRQ